MKKPLFFIGLFFLLLPFLSFSQSKYDYVWFFGYPPNNPELKFGGTLIDFRGIGTEVSFANIGLDMVLTSGAICDKNGNPQFYTNGCKVSNFHNQIIANGDSLNTPFTGHWQNDGCARGLSYGTRSGLIILPMPGTDDRYVIFHLRHDTSVASYPLYFHNPQSLLYTSVNMSAENGLGRVEQKNVLLQKDTFCDMLAAVRHGNGRDWWLAAPKPGSGDKASDKILLFLLTPYGIEGPFVRKTPLSWMGNPNEFTVGQAVFSPDGTRYARIDTENRVQLYCFDRCSGEFSCPVQLNFPGDTLTASGISFSPNGRFLYASTGTKMYQFDCSEKDIQRSKTLLGVYDGFKGRLWTTFYQQQLAPDGKIYMNCTNGAYYLHVVHNPDAEGKDCNFVQHSLELPTHNGSTLPIHPNFRLYDWASSPCDSLGIDAPHDTVRYSDESMRVFPNPTNERATVVLPECAWGSLRAYNAAGVLMQEIQNVTSGQTHTLEVEHWPAAVYFVTVMTRDQGAVTKRLVVQH